MFSAAISPQATAYILKAIELVCTDHTHTYIQNLWANVHYTKSQLQDAGFDIGYSESPIILLMVRNDEKVQRVVAELLKKRIFASGIVYPGVRPKESRIRISILASHTQSQIDYLVSSLNEINKDIHIKK